MRYFACSSASLTSCSTWVFTSGGAPSLGLSLHKQKKTEQLFKIVPVWKIRGIQKLYGEIQGQHIIISRRVILAIAENIVSENVIQDQLKVNAADFIFCQFHALFVIIDMRSITCNILLSLLLLLSHPYITFTIKVIEVYYHSLAIYYYYKVFVSTFPKQQQAIMVSPYHACSIPGIHFIVLNIKIYTFLRLFFISTK